MKYESSQTTLTANVRGILTRRTALIGAVTNFSLSVIQVIVGIIGHSQALVADAMHTFSDLLADGVAYWAASHANEAPDSEHPYGHARFETAAALGIASLLTLVGIGISWSAVERLIHPDVGVLPSTLTIYISGITILAKEALYQYAVSVANYLKSDMLRASAWHHRSDAFSSLIVFFSLIGTRAGWMYLDAIAAAVVGLMIVRIGIDLGTNAVRELVDTGLDAKRLQAIRDTILNVGGVKDLHMLRTRRLGGIAIADVHVIVEPRLSVSEGHMIGLVVEERLKQSVDELQDVTVHIDPEDDEVNPSCLGLPLRAEATKFLLSAWNAVEQPYDITHLNLHYLEGHIEVEVYLKFVTVIEAAKMQNMFESLQQAISARPEFVITQIYFGYK